MGTPLIRTRLEDLAVYYRELGSGNLESDPDYRENQSAVKVYNVIKEAFELVASVDEPSHDSRILLRSFCSLYLLP